MCRHLVRMSQKARFFEYSNESILKVYEYRNTENTAVYAHRRSKWRDIP